MAIEEQIERYGWVVSDPDKQPSWISNREQVCRNYLHAAATRAGIARRKWRTRRLADGRIIGCTVQGWLDYKVTFERLGRVTPGDLLAPGVWYADWGPLNDLSLRRLLAR